MRGKGKEGNGLSCVGMACLKVLDGQWKEARTLAERGRNLTLLLVCLMLYFFAPQTVKPLALYLYLYIHNCTVCYMIRCFVL